MLYSALIGLVAGARSLTPLAAVSIAANRGRLPEDSGAPPFLGHPLVTAGATALAAAELGGDKMKSAPDRIVPAGMLARVATAGIAGAALARRDRRWAGAAVAVAAASLSAYVTWTARIRAMERWGQTPTGLIEDALTGGAAALVVSKATAPA